jgi:predicted RNase H-like nuclease (RuvC/YqgF family)
VIVGFDPGTVAALAVLDLKGTLVFSKSFRGGFSQAVKLLSDFNPSVVASDRCSAESVRKLAASFGAVAFFPKEDLGVREKASLVRRYKLKDQHQKDALAAALYAHKHYQRLIDRVLNKEQEIFSKLVRGELANISRALEPGPRVRAVRRKRNFDLEGRVADLERKLELAECLLEVKEKELAELKRKFKGGRRGVRRIVSVAAREEMEARKRLELELTAAHGRLGKIEVKLKRLKGAPPEEKENISQCVVDMIREYKKRFRK